MNNDSLREELDNIKIKLYGDENRFTKLSYEDKNAIIDLISKECDRARPTPLRIGMLRQWLNEDRIKDAKRFVTNEMIEHWLELDTPERKK